MRNKLTWLQKAGALLPMAILVGAWGIAVGNSGLATAIGGTSSTIPQVPALAMEQPATVQRTLGGINAQAGAPGAISTLSTNGIPSAALYAYHHAETLLASADATCRLPWSLVAAIGRVESNHGRTEGASLTSDGTAIPAVFGTTSKRVADTDGGKYDKNAKADLPVGPMGMLPKALAGTLVDADNDGTPNPQDIDDEATAAGVFLCSGSGDLSTEAGARKAVQRYNPNSSYVDLVLKISASYANGLYSQTPDGYSTSTILTSQAYDQTLSEDEREEASDAQKKDDEEKEKAEKARERAAEEARRNPPKSSGGGGSNSDGGSGSDGDGGSDGGNGGGSGGGGGSGDSVGDTVKDVTDKVDDTVDEVKDTVDKVVKGVTGD